MSDQRAQQQLDGEQTAAADEDEDDDDVDDDILELAFARRDATGYRHAFCFSSGIGDETDDDDDDADFHAPVVEPKMTWSPQLKALLEGVKDENSPLSVFDGSESTILKKIYEIHVQGWADAVQLTPLKGSPTSTIAFSPCARVEFPVPKDRSVNMLPFILGQQDSLPEDLQDYYDDIILMCPLQDSEWKKVLYLTVEEGWVEAGSTQRRGGLHIESPRYTQFLEDPTHKEGKWERIPSQIRWGHSVLKDDQFIGGLYMASTVANTCRVYHALVDKTAVDTHGGLDHLAQLIPEEKGLDMRANVVYWMTDRTPHVVLPQAAREYRQFFQLVTSSLSIWNAAHNTPNPKVKLPDHVLVVNKSRFTNEDVDGSMKKRAKVSK
jgi:hypothetical protein